MMAFLEAAGRYPEKKAFFAGSGILVDLAKFYRSLLLVNVSIVHLFALRVRAPDR